MALQIGLTGNFPPFLGYNAKADKWYVKRGEEKIEISRPTFLADFKNIKTGWLHIADGLAPNAVWDEDRSLPVKKPSDAHKRSFQLRVYSQAAFGGVIEFSSCSLHVCTAVSELHDVYEKEQADHPGMFPVVECVGSEEMKSRHGSSYRPKFAIKKWVSSDIFKTETVIPSQITAAPPASPAAIATPPATTADSEF